METQTSRPSRAEQLVQEIVDSLGTPFTFELLVDYIQTKRKKLLRIEERPMPVSITGKCFELADVDLILTRTGLTLDRKLHTTLHECGHILCDPERFDPERWSPENEAKIPRYAYLPFGDGPHVCIGNHFAMMEAQFVLATLVQRVTFELVPRQTIEPEPLITLRAKGGIRVVVRRR